MAFSIHASMFSMFLYITLYMQNVLGYSPLESGLRFLPVSVLSFFAAPLAGKLAERYPVRFFLTAGLDPRGHRPAAHVGHHAERRLDHAARRASSSAASGIGFINPPLATAAIGVVEPRRSGAASGINSTFRQVGTAVGIAGLGAILQAKLPTTSARQLRDSRRRTRTSTRSTAAEVGAVVAFTGAASALVLIRRRDFVGAAA